MKLKRASPFVLATAAALFGGNGAAFAAAAEAASEVRSTVLLGGEVVGLQTTRVDELGVVHVVLRREERGEGLELRSRFVLGPGGVPREVEISGTGELGEPVAERFVLEGRTATWKDALEEGRAEIAGPAFYVAAEAPPEALALLARALLAAPGKRLPLLPAGEARIETIVPRALAGKEGALHATLYAVSGLDFAPAFVWLDGDGRFVASLTGVLHVVRSGWESAAKTLEETQEAAVAGLLAARARDAGRRPRGALVFRGVGLFDSAAGRVLPDRTVVVRGERIAAVGPRQEVAEPAGAEVVDGAGRTLLPGLWDLHAHVAPTDGLLYLAAGVTGVRDLANRLEKVVAIRSRWDSGEEAGPRLALAGYLNGPSGRGEGSLVEVATAAEARAAVDDYADQGYAQIKLYDALPLELVPVGVARAKQRGMRVSGHLPAGMSVRDAVEAGFDEIQHLHFLFRQWVPASTPGGPIGRAAAIAALDLASPEVEELVALLARRKVAVDPTLVVFEEVYGARVGGLSPVYAPMADRLPPQVRRELLRTAMLAPPGKAELFRRTFQRFLALTAKLHAAGVQLLPGTDARAGFTLHRELELRVEAGIPAARVLQSATLEAARVAGRGDELGVVAAGKLADLVLVEGDPVREVSSLRRVVLTVKDGVVYEAEQPAAAAPVAGREGGPPPAISAVVDRAITDRFVERVLAAHTTEPGKDVGPIGDRYHRSYEADGLELIHDRGGRIHTVFLRPATAERAGFRGELPRGIGFADTRPRVIQALGPAECTSEVGNVAPWETYGVDGFVVHVEYEPGYGAIREVTLQSRSTAPDPARGCE